MFYMGTPSNYTYNGSIFWATSTDGIHWTLHGLALKRDPSLYYETYSIGSPAVVNYTAGIIIYAATDGNNYRPGARYDYLPIALWNESSGTLTRTGKFAFTAPFMYGRGW